jgi:hypothetical protein
MERNRSMGPGRAPYRAGLAALPAIASTTEIVLGPVPQGFAASLLRLADRCSHLPAEYYEHVFVIDK